MLRRVLVPLAGLEPATCCEEITGDLLVCAVQLSLSRSGWAEILVSPVWLGAVVACGMSNGMTAISADYRALLRDDASVARRPGSS